MSNINSSYRSNHHISSDNNEGTTNQSSLSSSSEIDTNDNDIMNDREEVEEEEEEEEENDMGEEDNNNDNDNDDDDNTGNEGNDEDNDNEDENDDEEGNLDGNDDDTDSNDYFPFSVRQLVQFSSMTGGNDGDGASSNMAVLQERLRLRNLLFSWVCQNCTVTQPLRLRKVKPGDNNHTTTTTTTTTTNYPEEDRNRSLDHHPHHTNKEMIQKETDLHYEIDAYVKAVQYRLKSMSTYHTAKTLYTQQLLTWRAHRLAYEANELQEENTTILQFQNKNSSSVNDASDNTLFSSLSSSSSSSSSHHHTTLNMDISNTNNVTHETKNIHLHMDIDSTSSSSNLSNIGMTSRPSMLNNPPPPSSSSLHGGISDPGPPPSPPDYATILATLPTVPSSPMVSLDILRNQKCSNCGCTYIVPSESANKLLHDAHLQVDPEIEDEDNTGLGDAVAIMQTGAIDLSSEGSTTDPLSKRETMDILLPLNVNMDILRNTIDMEENDWKDYAEYTGINSETIHEILQGTTTNEISLQVPVATSSSSSSTTISTTTKVVPTLHEQITTPSPLDETYRKGFAGFAPTTAIIYDDRMLAHEEVKRPSNRQKNSLQFSLPGITLPPRALSPHPERPDRLRSIAQHLVAMGLFQRCKRIPAREITDEELRLVHTKNLVDNVNALPQYIRDGYGEYVYDTGDTFANPYTHLAARLSCGSVVAVTEAVVKGKADRGIALVRPPGHHAEPDHCMGFCLYNNIGVAAALAKERLGLKRILIVDWDVHHGNGTENMFYDDPSVLFVSLHRHDYGNFYPGTGHVHRVGTGNGEGYNVNIPWNSGGMGDIEYATAFDEIIMPIAYAYNPELVLVSCGFDAARGDPLGGCDLTSHGYAYMTHRLLSLAQGKVVVVLEGGYNLQSISRGMEAVLRTLLGQSPPNLLSMPARIHGKITGVAAELGTEQGNLLHSLGNWATKKSSSSSSGPTKKNDTNENENGDDDDNNNDEEDAYLDEYYRGQNRDEILSDIAPRSLCMDTIAEVVRIHSKYWPSLRIKYRAYAQIIEEKLRNKLRTEAGVERERSLSSVDDGTDTVWVRNSTVLKEPGTNHHGKPDQSTLVAVLKGEKGLPLRGSSSGDDGTGNSEDEDEEEDNEEEDELPPLVPNLPPPTKKARN